MKIFTEYQINPIIDGMMSPEGFSAREQRRHLRRFAAMDIMCMRYGDGSRREESGARSADRCVLANISKSGIAMESRKIYSVGDRILAVFTAAAGAAAAIEAEIVRFRAGEYGTLYGAKFSDANTRRIEEFNAYILKYFNLY